MWRYSEILRDNEGCLVFDPRDSGKRLKREERLLLEEDDYHISMTNHGKILVRWRQLKPNTYRRLQLDSRVGVGSVYCELWLFETQTKISVDAISFSVYQTAEPINK